mgnify:FL=1
MTVNSFSKEPSSGEDRTWFKSFYSKLVLGLLLSFSIIALMLTLLVQQLTKNYQSEVEQKLHLELAEHIVHDDSLLKDGKIDQAALEHTFHSMMILGPSFEFYVVNPNGTVTTYSAVDEKIKRMQVDLKPINQFLRGEGGLPILGDDPRSPYKKKIFSVAEIKHNGVLQGYLYIIIGGEVYDSVVDLLQESHIIKLSFWGFAATLFFSLIVVLLLFAMLTRPLRRLAMDMRLFRSEGFEKGNMPDSKWNETSADEIHRLGSTFNEMAGELKKQYEKVRTTDELRRELISYVSHDLRTPLASLQGYLETWQLKQKSISSEESAKLIQVAVDNAQHISRLVEQLFELAHLDAENMSLTLEPVSIAELAYDVTQKLQLEASNKNITLNVEPKDPSLMAMVNIEKIERVFTNLLENAIRHTSAGGQIVIHMLPKDEQLNVTVQDDGCGINERELPHIFEAHYRGSNQESKGQSASHSKVKRLHSGLGLAITKRIVELHGSEITVASQVDRGTCFSFYLKSV